MATTNPLTVDTDLDQVPDGARAPSSAPLPATNSAFSAQSPLSLPSSGSGSSDIDRQSEADLYSEPADALQFTDRLSSAQAANFPLFGDDARSEEWGAASELATAASFPASGSSGNQFSSNSGTSGSGCGSGFGFGSSNGIGSGSGSGSGNSDVENTLRLFIFEARRERDDERRRVAQLEGAVRALLGRQQSGRRTSPGLINPSASAPTGLDAVPPPVSTRSVQFADVVQRQISTSASDFGPDFGLSAPTTAFAVNSGVEYAVPATSVTSFPATARVCCPASNIQNSFASLSIASAAPVNSGISSASVQASSSGFIGQTNPAPVINSIYQTPASTNQLQTLLQPVYTPASASNNNNFQHPDSFSLFSTPSRFPAANSSLFQTPLSTTPVNALTQPPASIPNFSNNAGASAFSNSTSHPADYDPIRISKVVSTFKPFPVSPDSDIREWFGDFEVKCQFHQIDPGFWQRSALACIGSTALAKIQRAGYDKLYPDYNRFRDSVKVLLGRHEAPA